MALPVTLPDHGGTESVAWSVSGSGNFGPFLYNGNVYVLAVNHDTDATFPGDEVMMYKATDPTSSFSEVDYSGATILRATSGSGGSTFGNIEYFDAFQYPESPYIYVMAYVRNDNPVTTVDEVRHARFCCITDTWTTFASAVITYSATDKPTTWWGGITQRDDGDIIIVHPGENPTTMGGTYQEVAYSRLEVATTVTDGTTGLAFSTSGDTIIRPTGSWVTDGFSTTTTDGENIIRVRSSENGGENDGWYRVTSITTTTNTNDTLNLTDALNATNGADTTAVVFPEGLKNTTGYTLTAGVVVASTAAKNDNYLQAYPVMGSSDQVHFGYVRDSNRDFYLRALSSGNALRTQRTHAGTFDGVSGGTNFTRSSTEKIAFQVYSTVTIGYIDRIYFTHFTDDTSPTFTEEEIISVSSITDDVFTSSLIHDAANTTTQPNYAAYISQGTDDVYLADDGGGTTWSNTTTAIRTGTVDGVSGNIYERDGNQLYAFLYDDNGTVKYDEYTLYATAVSLTATEIESDSNVEQPALTQNHEVTATEIESDSNVEQPVLAQIVVLPAATEIKANTNVESPTAIHKWVLTATEIESESNVEGPALGQNHDLGAVDEIESDTNTESTDITQNHEITATEIESDSNVEQPLFTGVSVLPAATEIESDSNVEQPLITQNHSLAIDEIESDSNVEQPAFTGISILPSVTDIESDSNVEQPLFTGVSVLPAATEIESDSNVEQPIFASTSGIEVAEIESGSVLRGPVLINQNASIQGFQSYRANVAYSISTTTSVTAWHTLHATQTNCLVCCMSFMSGSVTSSPSKTYTVTFGGNPLTLGHSYVVPDDEFVSLIYYLTDPPTTNSQLSVSTNDTFKNITVSLVELSGIDTGDPIGNNQSASAETVAITPESSDSIIIGLRTQKEIGQGGVTPSTDNIEIIDYQGGGS